MKKAGTLMKPLWRITVQLAVICGISFFLIGGCDVFKNCSDPLNNNCFGEVTNENCAIFGDSVFDAPVSGGGIEKRIFELSGEVYRDYAKSGERLCHPSQVRATVAFQYNRSQCDLDINDYPGRYLVIMNGGGNDVQVAMKGICDERSACFDWAACEQEIDRIGDFVEEMLIKAHDVDGVENAVLLLYYHQPACAPGKPACQCVAGENCCPLFNQAIDYADDLAIEICDLYPYCHYVDPRVAFDANPAWVAPDRLHPTTDGAAVLGEMIWNVVEAEGICTRDNPEAPCKLPHLEPFDSGCGFIPPKYNPDCSGFPLPPY